jgi:GTP-binding protein YchF
MSVTRSHSLSVGIVGLPNAGKSTLFNSITKNSVPAQNFPFTTIDKNVGVLAIPDKRLDALEQFFNAKKKVSSMMTFVDIAGLVKGASKGEGLGNQFLSHIREVDVIMFVLRAFNSENIVHVYDRVNPADDLEIVLSELILKDIETVEKKIGEAKKNSKNLNDKSWVQSQDFYSRLMEWLGSGNPAIDFEIKEDEIPLMSDLWLLTNKKMMYVLNVREGMDEQQVKIWEEDLKSKVHNDSKDFIVCADVKMIGELSVMNEQEKEEYLSMLDSKPNLLDEVVSCAYQRLNLLTFYTGSEKEVNAWTIGKGATIKEGAGVIHTDLEHGFITADVVNVDKLIEVGGWVNAKEKGIVKNNSKTYLVQDGDYIIIYAN